MLVHHELVPTSTVEVAPWESYVENPSLHPQWESYRCHKKSYRVQKTLPNVWSNGKEEREISRDFMALNRLSLSRWLEDQTWLDCHKTWWAHSSLRILRCLKLVEDCLSRVSDLREVLTVHVTAIPEQSSFGRWFIWIVKRCLFLLNFGK